MDETILPLLGAGVTTVAAIVGERIYENPRIEFLSPEVVEEASIRYWMFPIRNRPGSLSRFIHRKSADALTAAISITSLRGLTINIDGYWHTRSDGAIGRSETTEVSLTEGDTKLISFVNKLAGNSNCNLSNNSINGNGPGIYLPEGTFMVSLKLGSGTQTVEKFYVLNNSGTELSRLQLKGPMKKKIAAEALIVPEILFPLGGTG